MITTAAGIMFMEPGGTVLMLRRGPGGDHSGEWCFPGGTTEGAETPEQTAERETIEELGFLPEGEKSILTRRIAEDVDYTTFFQRVPETFVPTINGEHTAFMWASPQSLLEGEPPTARMDTAGPHIPPGIRLEYYELLPGRENEAGYFEADGKFGDGGPGVLAVARKIRTGAGDRLLAEPARVLAHESGHALDHAMGAPSHELELPAPGERETAWEAIGARYYLATPEEFWAEAHAIGHGPEDAMYFGGMSKQRALGLFREEIATVLGAIATWENSSG